MREKCRLPQWGHSTSIIRSAITASVSSSVSIPGLIGRPVVGHRNKKVPITSSNVQCGASSGRPKEAPATGLDFTRPLRRCPCHVLQPSLSDSFATPALAGFNVKASQKVTKTPAYPQHPIQEPSAVRDCGFVDSPLRLQNCTNPSRMPNLWY